MYFYYYCLFCIKACNKNDEHKGWAARLRRTFEFEVTWRIVLHPKLRSETWVWRAKAWTTRFTSHFAKRKPWTTLKRFNSSQESTKLWASLTKQSGSFRSFQRIQESVFAKRNRTNLNNRNNTPWWAITSTNSTNTIKR